MRLGVLILAAIMLLGFAAAAQSMSKLKKKSLANDTWSPAIGTTLALGGTFATFNPYLKSQTIGFRDALQADGHAKLHFDDYIQYLPGVSPLTLKLCGLESRHTFWRIALLEGTSYLFGALLLNTAKYNLDVQRPDREAHNSFPSGHTFTAFTGAELVRLEYGECHPWVAATAYAVAALVGFMRLYNNRHWMGDVMAGAGLAILCTNITYWILD
ncbi:MAG: phosphatase PAP2 family protein [Bacteroidales bacterium]|nr:phosphatase PAP2 family protein [Bacteroidales bacterium]